MSLKNSLQERIRWFSEDVLPGALSDIGTRVERFRERLDHINCSLAERALPEERKSRVSELSLNRKAREAGQKLKVVKGAKKRKQANRSD
ncbi:hypothetical protein DIT71_11160 [Marinobacter vulgaris]|uniref:Uncharacterized protein n=1 Tax=Marinobacter vulgaris TaxID=1928331 RepID=A0A2V3ZKW2_9GAMM|nr:hypothetical protein [Marinobacter vulgaris]PXX91048.1 hypothetical protein DIT71_11160 [Marinobacter vulgaris]TSJ69968.1 hypothetical protein FPC41_09345 [Marinobacter vulgaris]